MSISIIRRSVYGVIAAGMVLYSSRLYAEEVIASILPAEVSQVESGTEVQDAVMLASLSEQAKWRFVQMQLTRGMNDAQSLFNKAGEFIHNHAVLIAMVDALFIAIPWVTGFGMGLVLADLRTNGSRILHSDQRVVEFVGGATVINMLAFLVMTASSYGLCKLIGGWLENRDDVCHTALGEYLLGWDTYKSQTPTMLHELFDSLATDMRNGGQWALDEKQARLIVEQVLAVAAIFNAVHA